MSNELKQKINIVQKILENFSNFIELNDFRSFLLFTLTSQVPTNILAQIGLGGSKEVISLPYNPIFNVYYQKINLISAGSLIIYVKNEPITDKFTLDKDDPIIKNYLNPNEMSLAFRGKEKFLLPKISDCSIFDVNGNSNLTIKVDDLFHSLESFLGVTEPNLLFVVGATNDSEPDLIFTFNMMPEMPSRFDQKVLKIDVFLDNDHKTRDKTYLKREEDFTVKYLKGIKEVSHAELYKSAFSLILHVKSFSNLE
ncbi:MAG: hypothetical protein JSV23_02630 [Promethearchaeota archaeon]|nr:MAG: hypothetical protein JSV23_02630 [Candidatus Lokiarchaeota archaeon]